MVSGCPYVCSQRCCGECFGQRRLLRRFRRLSRCCGRHGRGCSTLGRQRTAVNCIPQPVAGHQTSAGVLEAACRCRAPPCPRPGTCCWRLRLCCPGKRRHRRRLLPAAVLPEAHGARRRVSSSCLPVVIKVTASFRTTRVSFHPAGADIMQRACGAAACMERSTCRSLLFNACSRCFFAGSFGCVCCRKIFARR